MRSTIIALTLGLAAIGQSQARDWGFSKDTIWEWNEVSKDLDTLYLNNNSSDTLRFDSAWLEIVEPAGKYDRGYFAFRDGEVFTVATTLDYYIEIQNDPSGEMVPHTKKVLLKPFLTAKPSQLPIPDSDSITVRAIYHTKSMGSDTLIVFGRARVDETGTLVGIERKTTSPNNRRFSKPDKHLEANGRKVESSKTATPMLSIPASKKSGQ